MHQRIESEPPPQPVSKLSAVGMPFEELLRRTEERNQEEHRDLKLARTSRRRLRIANTLALLTLSLGASLFSADDSLSQHVIENNPRIEDTDRSNSDEIEVANVTILETPFILNLAKATITQAPEPTFKLTMQPIATAEPALTPIIIDEVGGDSGMQAQVELANCPSGWPVEHGEISQGPLGATSHAELYSDLGEQAIDIVADYDSQVFATFDGQVFQVNLDIRSGYGIFVDVKGVCDGQPFTARWAHLSGVAEGVTPGIEVGNRQMIGFVGATGRSDGLHVHYAFVGLEMAAPNVPITVFSLGCDSESECSVSW